MSADQERGYKTYQRMTSFMNLGIIRAFKAVNASLIDSSNITLMLPGKGGSTAGAGRAKSLKKLSLY